MVAYGESIPESNGGDDAPELISSVEVPSELAFVSRVIIDSRAARSPIPLQRPTPRIALELEEKILIESMHIAINAETSVDYMEEVLRISNSAIHAEEHRALQEIFRRTYIEINNGARDQDIGIDTEQRDRLLAHAVELRSLMNEHIQVAKHQERRLKIRDLRWPERKSVLPNSDPHLN
jgi:hypothetical protein